MRTLMRTLIVAGLVTAIAMLAGCTPAEKGQLRQEVQGARQTLDEVTSNAALTAKVKAGISTRKGLEGTHIHVDAKDGAVVLKGDVRSREEADLAEQVARETQGVRSVDNRLTIPVPAKSMPPSAGSGPAH